MCTKEEFLVLLQKELSEALLKYSNLRDKDDDVIQKLVNDEDLVLYLNNWIKTYYEHPEELRGKFLSLRRNHIWSKQPCENEIFHWNLRCDFIE